MNKFDNNKRKVCRTVDDMSARKSSMWDGTGTSHSPENKYKIIIYKKMY